MVGAKQDKYSDPNRVNHATTGRTKAHKVCWAHQRIEQKHGEWENIKDFPLFIALFRKKAITVIHEDCDICESNGTQTFFAEE